MEPLNDGGREVNDDSAVDIAPEPLKERGRKVGVKDNGRAVIRSSEARNNNIMNSNSHCGAADEKDVKEKKIVKRFGLCCQLWIKIEADATDSNPKGVLGLSRRSSITLRHSKLFLPLSPPEQAHYKPSLATKPRPDHLSKPLASA